jgi:hypothetical protein
MRKNIRKGRSSRGFSRIYIDKSTISTTEIFNFLQKVALCPKYGPNIGNFGHQNKQISIGMCSMLGTNWTPQNTTIIGLPRNCWRRDGSVITYIL